MTLQDMDKWPPFLVYAIARMKVGSGRSRRVIGLTLTQISSASGLPERTVCRVGNKITWADVTHKVSDAFCRGCRFDFDKVWTHRKFIRQNLESKLGRFAHLPVPRWNHYVRKCEEYERANKE